jgi:tryptophanase
MKTIIEPFKIKMVEPIRMSTRKEREVFLQKAFYNTFLLKSDQVIIDLLTDSGTSAMSAAQWAGIMQGDESYAGAASWSKMEMAIRDLTGHEFIFPTHQGRAAERILYGYLGKPGKIFISNTHFDTTRANIEFTGAEAVDIPCTSDPDSDFPFKGNIDLNKLEQLLRQKHNAVAGVIITATNNSGGGQPVSMENMKAASVLCRKYGVNLFLDACRIAENSWFIRQHEDGYQHHDCKSIAREMFSYSDGAVMSLKKDGLVNMGGFLSLRDKMLADACRNLLIITEGFITYGGLSGRDMEAIAQGLEEVFDHDYLHYRITSTAFLGKGLKALGIPVLWPVGGHAVYVDAARFYPHIPVYHYPAQALVCELYLAGGIRAVEIGSVMFGKYDADGNLIPARKELVRLAIPRRVYTQSHIEYVLEVFEELLKNKKMTTGFKIIKEPAFLRHFTCHFEKIRAD